MTPLVSVCIPTYNRARFMHETISSVLRQTYTDFELVISDDASADDTSSIVHSFSDSRLRYYRQPQRLGLARNLQAVINMAASPYIAIMSDDDLMLKHHLSAAIEALEQNPQVAYYACTALRFAENSSEEWRPVAITDTLSPLLYFSPPRAVDFLGIDTPGQIITLVCRRNRFHANLFWGPANYIPVDLLLMTSLMIQGGFVFGNQPGIRYRVHDTNSSNPTDSRALLRVVCMTWFGIRYLAEFLLKQGVCNSKEIEQRGLSAQSQHHVVQLVTALSDFCASHELRAIAKRVFHARNDMDAFSARFRVARRLGFWTIPMSIVASQLRSGWHP